MGDRARGRARLRKAGHRSWAARGGRVSGQHTGDIMSAEARSRVMSRIKGKDTGPEKAVAQTLLALGITFEQHLRSLPGRPDFVFPSEQVVVFVDGDFWHGWRFPLWMHKLSDTWQAKIAATRKRDLRNFRLLRARGWVVLRLWEHQVERDVNKCISRICDALERRRSQG